MNFDDLYTSLKFNKKEAEFLLEMLYLVEVPAGKEKRMNDLKGQI